MVVEVSTAHATAEYCKYHENYRHVRGVSVWPIMIFKTKMFIGSTWTVTRRGIKISGRTRTRIVPNVTLALRRSDFARALQGTATRFVGRDGNVVPTPAVLAGSVSKGQGALAGGGAYLASGWLGGPCAGQYSREKKEE